MFQFQVERELCLKTLSDGYGCMYSKVGAWIASTNGDRKLDYVLIGPGNDNMLKRFGSQLLRKFSGENLKLIKVQATQGCINYFADRGQHVTIVDISNGAQLKVESENILAFTDSCKYSIGFFSGGVVSQKGIATSTLTGTRPGSLVAVTCEGNPITIPTPCKIDPDALICYIGPDPQIKFDLSWKNVIGKANGESYYFDFNYQGGSVLIQPFERESGLNIAIDSGQANYNSQQPVTQQVSHVAGQVQQAGKIASTVQRFLGN